MVKDPTMLEAKKRLANVHPDHTFKLNNGSSIRNLKELYSALQRIEPGVFEHHVNQERNDFSNWVKDVHKDDRLANSLFSSKSKEELVKAVGNRIYELEKTAAPPRHSIALLPAPRTMSQVKAKEMIEKKPSIAPKTLPLPKRTIEPPKGMPGKKHSSPKPKHKGKSDTEIAKERLEKILMDAVKAKMARVKEKEAAEKKEKQAKEDKEERIKVIEQLPKEKMVPESKRTVFERASEPPKRPVSSTRPSGYEALNLYKPKVSAERKEPYSFVSQKKDQKPTAQEILSSIPKDDTYCEELIKFVESKGSAKQFMSEFSSIFTKSSFNVFKVDMKKMFALRKESGKENGQAPVSEPVSAKAGDKKEEMLSHLKKVYNDEIS